MGCAGSQNELAMTQFFVHLPPQPGHVLLTEVERLPQGQTLTVLKHKSPTVTVVVLTANIHLEESFPSSQKLLLFFFDCLCLEILKDVLWAASVEGPLRVKVSDCSTRDVYTDQ